MQIGKTARTENKLFRALSQNKYDGSPGVHQKVSSLLGIVPGVGIIFDRHVAEYREAIEPRNMEKNSFFQGTISRGYIRNCTDLCFLLDEIYSWLSSFVFEIEMSE